MSRPLHARPRRWPWVVGVGVVTAVIIAIAVASSQPGAPSPSDLPPSVSATQKEDSMSGPGTAPTGCLGGSGLDTDMILAAQSAAPHTSNGAVDVAAAILRWSQRAPLPDEAEANRMEDAVIASGATDGFRDMSAAFAKNGPNYPTGVEPGQTFSVSMIGGMWHLEEATADRVVVTVGGKYIVDGALTANHWVSGTFTLVWEDDTWKLLSASGERPWGKLAPIGRTFTGEC